MTTLGLAKKNNYHLVEFEYGDSASPSYVYLTDWSGGSSYDSKTWVATPQLGLTFPPNTGGLEEGALQVEVLASASALFASLVSGEPCSPVYVTVTRVSAPTAEDGGSTQYHVIVQRARVLKATSRKGVVRLDAVTPKSLLRVPLGAPCNYHCMWTLFGAGCALASISSAGTLSAIDASDDKKVTITGLGSAASLAPGATPGKFWHRGYVERSGVRVPIRDWASGAATTFYLTRRPPAAWVGQAVTVVPGCDKTQETCVARYDNVSQFAGLGYAIPSHHPVHEVT